MTESNLIREMCIPALLFGAVALLSGWVLVFVLRRLLALMEGGKE